MLSVSMANRSHLNAFNFHPPRIGCLIQCCLHPVGDLLPWIRKLLSVLTSLMVIESLQAIERKHKKTTLAPFGEDLSQALCPKHISENHNISKPLFALQRSFTWEWLPPRGGLSGWSPRHCLLPFWHFYQWWWLWEKSCWHIWHMTYMTNHIDTPWLGSRLCNISPRPQLLSLNHGRAPINVNINIILLHAECYQKVSWPMVHLLFTSGRYYDSKKWLQKMTYQWPKVVSEAIFSLNRGMFVFAVFRSGLRFSFRALEVP